MNSNQGAGNARKKVLFVITKSNFGGAQRYIYDLATNLPPDQFEVAVAFGGEGVLAQMLREKGVRTISVPHLTRDVRFGSDLMALKALIKLFKRERPAVVHLNSSKAGGLGTLAARLSGVNRIIFTAHGWPFWEKRNICARAAIFFFSYLTVVFSHATICISEHDRRAMRHMPFAGRKLHVVHNGIADIPFLTRDEARTILFSPFEIETHTHDVWLLSNGELTPNKNYFVALDAVAAYDATASQKIFYSIMSDGEQRGEIEAYISKKNLHDRVKLLGFIPDGRRYLRAFDIFFLPSRKEGVPYAILEARLAGIPIIASNVGGIPEVVTDGESSFLVEPQDIEGFVDALTRMTKNAQERGRFAAALQTKVISNSPLQSMLGSTIALY